MHSLVDWQCLTNEWKTTKNKVEKRGGQAPAKRTIIRCCTELGWQELQGSRARAAKALRDGHKEKARAYMAAVQGSKQV